MSPVPILAPRVPDRVPRIVVAPRLPAFPKNYRGFESIGDIVAECDVLINEQTGERCGWKAMGPRAEIKKAADEHHKVFHPDQLGVVLLNQPRQ